MAQKRLASSSISATMVTGRAVNGSGSDHSVMVHFMRILATCAYNILPTFSFSPFQSRWHPGRSLRIAIDTKSVAHTITLAQKIPILALLSSPPQEAESIYISHLAQSFLIIV